MEKQAWGQNAVITDDNGMHIRWKPRCPYCGFIPLNRDYGASIGAGGRTHDQVFCDKCGETIKVVFSRG